MSAYILKIIALITMTIDHIGAVFELHDAFRCIGRIAFPLYALMVVDGCEHLLKDEKRFKRYMIFMCIMAAISECGFDLAFYGRPWATEMQNQLFQFASYIIGIYITDYFRKPYISVPVWLLIIYINFTGRFGYFSSGIILMLIFREYLKHYKKMSLPTRLLCCGVIIAILVYNELFDGLFYYLHDLDTVQRYIQRRGLHISNVNMHTYLAVPFLALYNGEYGNIPKPFRFLYRHYYPVHLYVLALLNYII